MCVFLHTITSEKTAHKRIGEITMYYYLVKCKFGHVGRNKYLPLEIPISATSMKEASLIARKVRGVKKNHKDWCLDLPKLVSYQDYLNALDAYRKDIYFEKHTRSRIELFEERLENEPNYSIYKDKKTNKKTYLKYRDKDTIQYKQNKKKLLEGIKNLCIRDLYYKDNSIGSVTR